MTRNSILHYTKNHVSLDELTTMAEKLSWYRDNQHEVLDYRHRYLADNNETTIQGCSANLRRAQLALLDSARRYHNTEIGQRQQNQTTITDWFSRYMQLRSGRFLGPGLKNIQTHTGLAETPPSDDEFEFDWDPRS